MRLAVAPRCPWLPGLPLGAFVANATGDRNLPLALVFAAVNVMEFVLVARLAEGYFGRPFQLDTLRRVGGFFLATCVGAGVSSLGCDVCDLHPCRAALAAVRSLARVVPL